MSLVELSQIMLCSLLTGLIWVIQLVHYPAFHHIDQQRFAAFEEFHSQRITFIVGIAMPLELATAILVYLDGSWPEWFSLMNILGILLIWGVTAVFSIPCHNRLTKGYDKATVDRLIATNWLRTAIWSMRAAAMFFLVKMN